MKNFGAGSNHLQETYSSIYTSVQQLFFQAQSWTALFRAFSSHRQPSAIFSKVFPAEQTSWPNWQTLLVCREADA